MNSVYLVLQFDNDLINIPFRGLEYVDEFTSIYDNPLDLVASLNRYLELGIPKEEILDAYLASNLFNISDDMQEFKDRSLAIKYNRDRFDKDDLINKLANYFKTNIKRLDQFSGVNDVLKNYRNKKGLTGSITDKELDIVSQIYLSDSYKRRKECYFKLKDNGIRTKVNEIKIDYSKVTVKELEDEELFMLITLTNMSLDELKEYTKSQLTSGRVR